MVDFIDHKYHENITLAEIARQGNMSISNANRCFKETLSYPPIEYLIQVRIKNAITLLLEDKYNISQIALMCGFKDSNYFTKKFKKKVGMPPRQFKRKNLKQTI
jgi:AraC-like DNA-binding protein